MPLVDESDDPQAEQMFSVPMTVYDRLGNDYKVDVLFWKVDADADGSTWQWEIPSTGSGYTAGTIRFDAEGIIDSESSTRSATWYLYPILQLARANSRSYLISQK